MATEAGTVSVAQVALAATTLTDIYTCKRRSTVLLTCVHVCNRGAATTFRLAIAYAGAADDVSQYLFYDTILPANSSFPAEWVRGWALGYGDVVRAYAGSANVSVNAGAEITPDEDGDGVAA